MPSSARLGLVPFQLDLAQLGKFQLELITSLTKYSVLQTTKPLEFIWIKNGLFQMVLKRWLGLLLLYCYLKCMNIFCPNIRLNMYHLIHYTNTSVKNLLLFISIFFENDSNRLFYYFARIFGYIRMHIAHKYPHCTCNCLKNVQAQLQFALNLDCPIKN